MGANNIQLLSGGLVRLEPTTNKVAFEPLTIDLLTNLVSVWELDETSAGAVVDSHGSNNGTNVGCTINQAGVTNLTPAYSYNGTTDFIYIPAACKLTSTFTVSMWIYPTSWSTGTYVGVFGGESFGATGNNGGIALGLHSNDAMYFDIYSSTTRYAIKTSIASMPATSSWTHVVMTYDGTDMALYYNNSLAEPDAAVPYNPLEIGSHTISWAGTDGGKSLCLGASYRSTARWEFQGTIDQCAMWSRAISSDERTALYNSGGGLAYSSWT